MDYEDRQLLFTLRSRRRTRNLLYVAVGLMTEEEMVQDLRRFDQVGPKLVELADELISINTN